MPARRWKGKRCCKCAASDHEGFDSCDLTQTDEAMFISQPRAADLVISVGVTKENGDKISARCRVWGDLHMGDGRWQIRVVLAAYSLVVTALASSPSWSHTEHAMEFQGILHCPLSE